jgi:hypothetical protein
LTSLTTQARSGKGWFDDKDAEYYESKEKVWGSFGVKMLNKTSNNKEECKTESRILSAEHTGVGGGSGS